jgi:hypothetical protein
MSGIWYFCATGRRQRAAARDLAEHRYDLVLRDQLGDRARRFFGTALVVFDEQPDFPPAEHAAAVLISSTASWAPSTEDCPNEAPSPVREPYMPTRMSPVVLCSAVPDRRSQRQRQSSTSAKR